MLIKLEMSILGKNVVKDQNSFRETNADLIQCIGSHIRDIFYCLETEFILFTSPDKKARVVTTQAYEIFPGLYFFHFSPMFAFES